MKSSIFFLIEVWPSFFNTFQIYIGSEIYQLKY